MPESRHPHAARPALPPPFQVSSGNVFADLGFKESEQELAKAAMIVRLYNLLSERGITQAEAAKLLGATPRQVAALMRCKPVSVPVRRLVEFLSLLGHDAPLTKTTAKRK